MNVYMVMKGQDKVLETTNYSNAVMTCRMIDHECGYGTSSLWRMDTNKSNSFSRMNFYTNSMTSISNTLKISIHDKSYLGR